MISVEYILVEMTTTEIVLVGRYNSFSGFDCSPIRLSILLWL